MTRVAWLIAAMALCGGCASHHVRVDCDGALIPINASFQQSPTTEPKPASDDRWKGLPTREDRT